VPAIERGLPGLIACQRHVECSLIVSVRGYRIRLTDQLVRPALRHLRQRGDAAELTGGKLSLLLQVSQCFSTSDGPGDGPGVDLARWGSCGIPST
jgi:hypothetical protein